MSVPLWAAGRPPGDRRYWVHPAPGVSVVGDSSGTLLWEGPSAPAIPLTLCILEFGGSGVVLAGTIAGEWPDGTRDSTHVGLARSRRGLPHRVLAPGTARPAVNDGGSTVTRRSPPMVGGFAKDLTFEITEASRAVPPGGVVMLRYVLYNVEGNAGRFRLRVDAPPGWNLLDAEALERERMLETWEIVNGELRITTPPDAPVGPRQLIRLTVEMVDEPGVAEALTHVQILNGSGLKPGAAHLAGTTALTLSRLEASGLGGARVVGVVDLSGKLGEQTHLSLSYRQGPRENRSNFRYDLEERYLGGGIRHAGWNLEFGNRIASAGNVLTGPSVDGNGVALRRMDGRVTGEVVLAQPTTFGGEGAGHLWRGNLGVKTALGTLSLALSDFERPEGGYTTLPPILDATLDPDSLEALERERDLSAASASTRVRGLGVDASLQLARAHRLVLRGGTLRLENAQGEAVSAPAIEAQYSFSGRSASFNTRWLQAPPSVQGIHLPGDELSVDGSLRLVSELQLVARAYQYKNETLAQSYRSETEGRSLGLRYVRRRWRVEVHGNRREVNFSTHSLRRTGQLSMGLPLGPASFNANAEIGEEVNSRGLHPFRSYRGDLRWSGKPGHAAFSLSSYQSGGSPPRLRADLLGSVTLGEFELAGGAWATRGWTAGGEPGLWTNVGLPVTPELTLLLGIEHAERPHARDASPWRASVGLRKKLILPLPFLPDGSTEQGLP